MSQPFDPYYRWLGIPAEEQPPDFYRLLGVRRFESDPEVISNAADRQMLHVRSFQTGPRSAECQRLLNELAAARTCLLNPSKKEEYDRELHTAHGDLDSPALPPQFAAQPQPLARGPAAPLAAAPPLAAQAVGGMAPAAPAVAPAPVRGRRSRRPSRTSPMVLAIEVLVGAVVGVAVALGVLWYGFGADPLGVMRQLSGEDQHLASSDDKRSSGNEPGQSESDPVPNPSPATGVSKQPGDAAARAQSANNAGPGPSSSGSSASSADDPDNLPESGASPLPRANPAADGSLGPRSLADLMQPSEKHPLPTEEQKREARQKLRQVVGEDLTPASSIADRRARLARLTDLANQLETEPNVLYVVLQEAYLEAGNLRQYDETSKIVDTLVEHFQVDEFAVRSKMIQDFAGIARTPAERMSVASAAMNLAEQAHTQHHDDVAAEMAALAETQAAKAGNAAARAQARQRAGEYRKLARLKEGYDKARAVLAENPDDPAANATVGRYRILMYGDDAGGLPHLAQGDDPRFQEIAERDLAGALSSQDRLALADAWFDLAKSDPELTPLYARARHWYRLAEEDASPLVQVNIRRRLDEIAEKEATGEFIDPTQTPPPEESAAATPSSAKKKKRR
jgi:hypothetical protein